MSAQSSDNNNTANPSAWSMVVGLEVHAQLSTVSKLFSGASTSFGALPNTQACHIDLALPGVLPVPNAEAVRKGITFGLAVGAQVERRMQFERKNYFYPDLPKGYQITQLEAPVVSGGSLTIPLPNDQWKTVNITRAHLEEDAGKLIHENMGHHSAVDLNRAGVPLLEIVSEPEIFSPEEAVSYLKTLHRLIRWIGISDGEMQEGSMRCDANISVRRSTSDPFGTRVEIKNVNSFRFVEKALEYEFDRQVSVLEAGGTIIQETRLYDSAKDETRSMRKKEEAMDYRYFPEPDLVPIVLDQSMVDAVAAELVELPSSYAQRFQASYGLSDYDTSILLTSKSLADFFEDTLRKLPSQTQEDAKILCNWVMGDLSALWNESGTSAADSPVSTTDLAQLVGLIQANTITNKLAKEVFEHMHQDQLSPSEVVEKYNLSSIGGEDEIAKLIEQVLNDNPGQLADYLGGKDRLFGFFVGQVMKLTQGRADPNTVNTLLKSQLAARA